MPRPSPASSPRAWRRRPRPCDPASFRQQPVNRPELLSGGRLARGRASLRLRRGLFQRRVRRVAPRPFAAVARPVQIAQVFPCGTGWVGGNIQFPFIFRRAFAPFGVTRADVAPAADPIVRVSVMIVFPSPPSRTALPRSNGIYARTALLRRVFFRKRNPPANRIRPPSAPPSWRRPRRPRPRYSGSGRRKRCRASGRSSRAAWPGINTRPCASMLFPEKETLIRVALVLQPDLSIGLICESRSSWPSQSALG